MCKQRQPKRTRIHIQRPRDHHCTKLVSLSRVSPDKIILCICLHKKAAREDSLANGLASRFAAIHSHHNSLPGDQDRTTKPQHRHQAEVSLGKISESVWRLGKASRSNSHLQNRSLAHARQVGVVELLARRATDLLHAGRAHILHLVRRHAGAESARRMETDEGRAAGDLFGGDRPACGIGFWNNNTTVVWLGAHIR